MSDSQNYQWSEWLDFNEEQISNVSETPGVITMHAAMKTLYIGGSKNMKSELLQCLKKECTSIASRFKFLETSDFEKVKNEMIKDFQNSHDGNMPKCM